MNKLVIFNDYLVDKFDNVLLVKKKKRGGGEIGKKYVWIDIVVIILFDFLYIDYNIYFVYFILG